MQLPEVLAWESADDGMQPGEVSEFDDSVFDDLRASDDEEEDFVKKLVTDSEEDSDDEKHDSGIRCALMESDDQNRVQPGDKPSGPPHPNAQEQCQEF